jgi:hypothetical protein
MSQKKVDIPELLEQFTNAVNNQAYLSDDQYAEKIRKLGNDKNSSYSRLKKFRENQFSEEQYNTYQLSLKIVKNIMDKAKEEQEHKYEVSTKGPKKHHKALVNIFEIKPPPIFDNNKLTYKQIQHKVHEKLNKFYWKDNTKHTKFQCGNPSSLNNAQKLCYHYMHPYASNDTNLLLYHSAGSGKTATMSIIASLFMRANRPVIYVTKVSLKTGNIYMKEAFEKNADFNIQQWLKHNQCDSISEFLQKSNKKKKITDEMIMTQGEKIYKEMKIQKPTILTYKQFSNICDEALLYKGGHYDRKIMEKLHKNDPWVFVRGNPTNNNLRDPFRNCLLIIDEAHKLVSKTVADGENDLGNISSIQEILFRSRERGKQNPKIQRKGTKSNNPKIQRKGKKSNNPNNLPVRVLLATATPVVESKVDAAALLQLMCHREEQIIDINKDVDWFAQKDEIIKSYDVDEVKLQNLTKGRVSVFNYTGEISHFVQISVTTHLVNMSEVQYNSLTDCKNKKRLSSSRNKEILEKKCIGDAVNWPGTKKPQNRMDIRRKSPMLDKLMKEIQNQFAASANLMNQFNAKIKQTKQYIYVDSITTGKGSFIIAEALKIYGYKSLTRDIKTGGVYQSVLIKENIPKYGGFINLTNRSKKIQNDLLNIYNNKNNIDGVKCLIIILNGSLKEGISLADVGHTHLFGVIQTKSDIVQASARAMRNCRSTNLPFQEGKGAIMGISMYKPKISNKKDDDQTSKDLMLQRSIIKECAIDRTLLKDINDASQVQEDKLLKPPKKPQYDYYDDDDDEDDEDEDEEEEYDNTKGTENFVDLTEVEEIDDSKYEPYDDDDDDDDDNEDGDDNEDDDNNEDDDDNEDNDYAVDDF